MVLDSTRVSPVTLSFSTVISTEYMADTRGTGYATATRPSAPRWAAAKPGRGAGSAEPSSGDNLGMALPSSTSFHGSLVPWSEAWIPLLHTSPTLAAQPHLESLILSHLLRGETVPRGPPSPRSQLQLELGSTCPGSLHYLFFMPGFSQLWNLSSPTSL